MPCRLHWICLFLVCFGGAHGVSRADTVQEMFISVDAGGVIGGKGAKTCGSGFWGLSKTNCPLDKMWLSQFAALDPNPDKVVLSVGCNLGDDLIYAMSLWNSSSLSPDVYSKHMRSSLHGEKYNGGVCGEGLAIENLSQVVSKNPQTRGFCVEPARSVSKVVEETLQKANAAAAFTLVQAAVSDEVKHSVPFVDLGSTHETGAIGSSSDGNVVPQTTLDALFDTYGLTNRPVDILNIDTEGNDAKVIDGMSATNKKNIRYMMFEYHHVGDWGARDLNNGLKKTIMDLDSVGMECYWAGGKHPEVDGQHPLWRITGCWQDEFYEKRTWSNVACVRRGDPWETVMESLVDPRQSVRALRGVRF